MPTKLSKIERFANGLSTEFGRKVNMATTLKTFVKAGKNMETLLGEKGLERIGVGEKKNFDGSSRSNKKSIFSKSSSKKFGSGRESKWCQKCKKKQSGQCGEELTCFKSGKNWSLRQ